MPKSEQRLKRIYIEKLKSLVDLELDFTERPLTAILGPNGSGKSTILHAISCINNPVAGTVNHKLSEFFTPTTHSIWTGSGFDVFQDFRDERNFTTDHKTPFRKNRERWSPRYFRRIERYTSFIGIRTCVPRIETETQQARIRFNTIPLNDQKSNKVKELAGKVMNRDYTLYNEHKAGKSKRYIGVSYQGINYSSLSMGAGEQRIFYILSEVVNAPKYGLIIIDEIDLLLHQDALFRLLYILNTIAIDKNLQIIFTTHAQSILSLDFIAIRHIYQTSEKTLCFTQTKPDILQRLTGTNSRPLEIFVEDDLAKVLIYKISSEEGLFKYVSVKCFGAAINCFTSVCGSILNNINNQENMLFVLDGDKFSTDNEKREKINYVLTGTSPSNDVQRKTAFERITQFVITSNIKPEKYYHQIICKINVDKLDPEQIIIQREALCIENPLDDHKFFNDIIEKMNFTREVGLTKLVDILSKSDEWITIKSNIKNWLDRKREIVELCP